MEIHGFNTKILGLFQDSGIRWIRRWSLPWAQVEPQEGVRNWQALENLEKEMVIAAEAGFLLDMIVFSTPEWAARTPGYACSAIREDKLAAFADFMRDVVARYSQPPYNLKLWELGNEPDVDPSLVPTDNPFGCWGDIADPYYGGRYYAQMLKQVYPVIKSADPYSQVLIGGLALDCDPLTPRPGKDCTPSRFLEGILLEGGGDYFDVVSFHNYDYYSPPFDYANPNWHSSRSTVGPSLIPRARYLRSLLDAYGYGDKPLMNTETGLLCGRDGSEPECLAQDYQLTKAYYAAQANVTALAEGLEANIWFSLRGWRGTALVGSEFSPLPVFQSLRFSASTLEDADFIQPVTIYAGVQGYEFSKAGKKFWWLWSQDGQDHTILLFTPPSTIYDVFGEALPASLEAVISLAPIYIEWGD